MIITSREVEQKKKMVSWRWGAKPFLNINFFQVRSNWKEEIDREVLYSKILEQFFLGFSKRRQFTSSSRGS